MNRVILMGRLVRDVDIRYSQGEKPIAIARYTLAVDRKFKRDGEPSADFINCIAFGKNGEFAEEKNGVPKSVKDLLKDAEWIKKTLLKVAESLNDLDGESPKPSYMDRVQFYNYILDKFNLSEDAARIIDKILRFVESHYKDVYEQHNVLRSLLCGTVGLTDNEIKRVCM